jgi:hypothetical protein
MDDRKNKLTEATDLFAEIVGRLRIMGDDEAEAEAAARAAELVEQKSKQHRAWGIPQKDSHLILHGEIRRSPALAALQRLTDEQDADRGAESPKSSVLVVLSGGVGCGKSTAGSIWLAAGNPNHHPEWQRPRSPRRFVTAQEFERTSRYGNDFFQQVVTASMLVLDDLGPEYADAKGNFKSDLDALINERYSEWRATVITTNLGPTDFRERYGDRICDRVRGSGHFIAVDGDSLRQEDLPPPKRWP